jgi:hypothetical protein
MSATARIRINSGKPMPNMAFLLLERLSEEFGSPPGGVSPVRDFSLNSRMMRPGLSPG